MKGKIGIVGLVMLLLGAMTTFPVYSATNRVYVEPASLDLSGRTLGYRFCVIIWCESAPRVWNWQVWLKFPDWLNCVKAGYCNPIRNATYPHDWSKSELFDSKSTTPFLPEISNNPGSKYVRQPESLIGHETGVNGSKRLFWAEFEIVAVPPEHGSLTGAIDSNDSYTWLLDADMFNIDIVKEKCSLTFNWGRHDISVLGLAPSKNVVGQGYSLIINVMIGNHGNYTENFNLTLYANASVIETQNITLSNGDSSVITFVWTTDLDRGNYTLSAIADTVQNETYTADNILIDGTVLVTLPGDINGDRKVDGKDVALTAKYFGSTSGFPPDADVNNDGKVDGKDIAIVAKFFGQIESPQPTILLLVNETVYPQIANSIGTYQDDLASEGYYTIVYPVENGVTPPETKSIIRSYYNTYNVSGCILIGDIKAAYSEIRTGDYSNPQALRIWISLDAVDMYYMDLDGYWENVTNPDFYAHKPPNVVEVHLYPSCQTFYNEYIVYLNETKKWDYSTIENKTQYQAEIWVSRIMGHNIDISGKSEADIINDFFEWDHHYKGEQKEIENSAYLLNAIGPGFNDQNMNYSNIFNSTIKMEYVTKSEYSGIIQNQNGSMLVYITAHSWPQGHQLYDASLTVDELDDSNKTSVFYILNACSACRWDQYVSSPVSPDYLGGIYVFDKETNEDNYGLGAIGFTGVGGFNWLEFFTDYLQENPDGSYGEAYKYWFNENLMRIFGTTNYVYLGDPTIGPGI